MLLVDVKKNGNWNLMKAESFKDVGDMLDLNLEVEDAKILPIPETKEEIKTFFQQLEEVSFIND